MTALLTFTVAGTPAPQGSKTFVPTAQGGRSKESNEKTLKPWRNKIADVARDAMDGQPPFTGPLRLVVTFAFARPQGHYGTGRNAGSLKPSAPLFCDKRPDLDKLVRAVGDALTGIVVVDDSTFVELAAAKRYGSPGVTVTIRGLG